MWNLTRRRCRWEAVVASAALAVVAACGEGGGEAGGDAPACPGVASGAAGYHLRAAARYAALAGPSAVALGKIDGDDRIDAVVASTSSGMVAVLLGTAGGGFGPPHVFAGGARQGDVAVLDVDGDGLADVMVADDVGAGNVHDGALTVLRGDGQGGLATPDPRPIAAAAAAAEVNAITVADADGDGRVDALVTYDSQVDPSSAYLQVIYDGGGGAGVLTGARPFGAAVGDFNHDGILDLAAASSGYGGVINGGPRPPATTVALGTGDRVFAVPSMRTAVATRWIAAADVDRDCNADLVTSAGYLPGDGDGTFGAMQPAVAGRMMVIDVDGDGLVDRVSASDGAVIVARGAGDGSFADTSFASDGVADAMAAADLNGDGLLDVVVPARTGGEVAVLLGAAP